MCGMSNLIEKLTQEDLNTIERLIAMPTIILNYDEVLFINSNAQEMLGYDLEELNKMGLENILDQEQKSLFLENMDNTFKGEYYNEKHELCLKTKNDAFIWVDFKGKVVSYNAKKYILAHLLDITDKKKVQFHFSKILKLREAMLEVTQSIIRTEKIDTIYELILKNALKSIKHAKLGSIMLEDKGKLKIISQIGFEDDSIKDFQIPITESFLYKATSGKFDRIAKIDDLMELGDYYHISTSKGERGFIKSTITAPIYIKNNFFGVVNIDAIEKNSFDEDDIKAMEFIRNNVEIAISNHLLYKEKIYLSRYDIEKPL